MTAQLPKSCSRSAHYARSPVTRVPDWYGESTRTVLARGRNGYLEIPISPFGDLGAQFFRACIVTAHVDALGFQPDRSYVIAGYNEEHATFLFHAGSHHLTCVDWTRVQFDLNDELDIRVDRRDANISGVQT